jgi:two-component system C4-dicarboxylate transport sensor histidine kinase DctB
MPRFRSLPLLFVCLLLVGLSGFSAYRIGQRLGIADLQATGLHRLDLYATSLEREIGKYAFLPGTLSLAPEVIDLLAGGGDGARVNAYLEKLNERAGTLSIYVMDTQGKVLATSNWRRPDSFLGEDLSFRPYFREALENGSGRFFGIGTTRGEPAYLASALTGDNGTLGVAVIKVSLEQLENRGPPSKPVLVADENGVVILSAVSGWKFTTLRPLDEATRAAFDHTQQYNRRALQPLGIKPLADYDHGARWSASPPAGRNGLGLPGHRPLPRTVAHPARHAWTLTVLSHLEQVDSLAQSRVRRWPPLPLPACACSASSSTNGGATCATGWPRAKPCSRRTTSWNARWRSAPPTCRPPTASCRTRWRTHPRRAHAARRPGRTGAGRQAGGHRPAVDRHRPRTEPAAGRAAHPVGNAERFLERGDVDTTHQPRPHRRPGDRMGRITGQLRNFARKSSGQSAPVALCQAVDNALALLDARLRRASAEVAAPARSMSRWRCATPTAWSRCWST